MGTSAFGNADDITVGFLADLSGLSDGFKKAAGIVATGANEIRTAAGIILPASMGKAVDAVKKVGEQSVASAGHLKRLAIEATRFGASLAALGGAGSGPMLAVTIGLAAITAGLSAYIARSREAADEARHLHDELLRSAQLNADPLFNERKTVASAQAAAAAYQVEVDALEQLVRAEEAHADMVNEQDNALLAALYKRQATARAHMAELRADVTEAQRLLTTAATVPLGPSTDQFRAVHKAQFDYQMALAEDSYTRKRALMDAELAYVKRTYGEQSAQYLAMLTQIENAERAHQAELIRIAEQARAAREQANQQDKQKRQSEIRKEQEAEEASRKLLKEASGEFKKPKGDEKEKEDIFAPMRDSWNRALADMLSGAHGFRANVRTVLGGVAQVFDQMIIKMVNAWLAGHAKMIVISIAHGLKDIAIKAAQAGAAAAASVANIPFTGWAMAIPVGLGTLAAVLALRNNIASASGGWDRVPFDQPALLHKNEMVLPATLAEKMRTITDGGTGETYNIHIHAMDGQSFGEFITRNDDTWMRTIRRAVRDGRT